MMTNAIDLATAILFIAGTFFGAGLAVLCVVSILVYTERNQDD